MMLMRKMGTNGKVWFKKKLGSYLCIKGGLKSHNESVHKDQSYYCGGGEGYGKIRGIGGDYTSNE